MIVQTNSWSWACQRIGNKKWVKKVVCFYMEGNVHSYVDIIDEVLRGFSCMAIIIIARILTNI